MELEEHSEVRKAIEPALNDLGYEIVRLKWMGGSVVRTLQIMAEPINGSLMQVDDCEKISHSVSAILDVEDLIKEQYNLEVSSPGIDRPLTRLKDYARFAGFDAKFQTREFYEGKRKFKGKILAAENDNVTFELIDKAGKLEVPFAGITEARLVLTDELIKFVQKNKKAN